MTARMAVVARQNLAWRTVVLAALACVLLAVALSQALQPGNDASTTPPSTRAGAASHGALNRLAPAARASISAAVGANDPAYRFRAASGGFQAANPAEHVGITATRAGVSVRGRDLRLGLRLQAIGYGSSLRAVRPLAPTGKANRVIYAHPALSEWYANGPLGLEQGFNLTRAPEPRTAAPLTLAMSLSGDARASLAAGGHSVNFTTAAGGSLRYGDLTVTDASGRVLASSLALERGRLMLRVDTGRARFPLRIDPTVEVAERKLENETAKQENENEEREGGEHAGISVALSADGNTALVGAPEAEPGGRVWVFERAEGQEFALGTTLTIHVEGSIQKGCMEDSKVEEDECSFGTSVAISADGQTAIVGAARADKGVGSAWVFLHTASGWEGTELKTPDLSGEEPDPQDAEDGHFGRGVALSADGQTALIGAPAENGGLGEAWIFTFSGSSWAPVEKPLVGSGEKGQDTRFGRAVALSGDGTVALVGAPGDDAAWVFEDAGGEWVERGGELTVGEGADNGFGASVALSGDGSIALVGAPQEDSGSKDAETGAAWVFEHAGEKWEPHGPGLTPQSGTGGEQFGASVALSADGTTAVIGAPHADENAGMAWLYERSEAGFEAEKELEEPEGRHGGGGTRFGRSVAMSSTGETVLVGAPSLNGRRGAVWVFGRGPAVTSVSDASGSCAESPCAAEGPQAGGTTVEIAGQHFENVKSVHFGAVAATNVEVESPTLIKAVSPPGRGTVDVTVTTSLGNDEVTSAINPPADQFTYLQPKKEMEGETGGHRGNPPPNTTEDNDKQTVNGLTGGTSTTLVAQQVLTFGPRLRTCSVSLRSRKVAVTPTHVSALLKLRGSGTTATTCHGKLRLSVKVKPTGASKHAKAKTIGTARFAIASGRTLVVKVKLNVLGRALFQADHGRMSAILAIIKSSPSPVQARAANVSLKRQMPPKPRPKPAPKTG
jgi:FG-GAP repeat/IPT/TIG domain